MENKVSKKYIELESKLKELSLKDVILVGVMSMARTINVLRIISKEQGFENIYKLKESVDIILDIILFNKKQRIGELDLKCEICNEIIPILEAYENNDNNIIMECSYDLIEMWYYFVDFDYCNIDEMVRGSMRKFIITGGRIIQEYLDAKYNDINEEEIGLIDEVIILDKELMRIDNDIAFLERHKWDDKKIRAVIEDYEKINILVN